MRLRKSWMLLGLFAVLVLALLAAAPTQAQDGGDPANGAQLYLANCQVCHGERGEGRAGATLSAIYGGISPDEFLRETIARGVEGTFMPAWSEANGGPLTDSQINDLTAYIESWGTTVEPPVPLPPRPEQNIPPVAEVSGDPNAGYSIFAVDCAVCHGEDGKGRIGANLSNFGGIAPGAFAISTISRGVEGSLMPPFGQENGGPLTDTQINDVAAYVMTLQGGSVYVPAGEQVGQASAWPLVLALIGMVVLVLVLGIAVNRREAATSRSGGGDEDH